MNKRHATCLKSQKSNGKQFLPFTLLIEVISAKQCFSFVALATGNTVISKGLLFFRSNTSKRTPDKQAD